MTSSEYPELEWRSSSLSAGGACLEIALTRASILVRDSKSPDGPVLVFPPDSWHKFIANLRADLLHQIILRN